MKNLGGLLGLRTFALMFGGLATAAFPASDGNALPDSALNRELQSVIADPVYKYSTWGVLVYDLERRDEVVSINADKLFSPASVAKLFPVASAIEELGSDYRIRTPVYSSGELGANGTLHGDLILVAQGDISLGRADANGGVAYTENDHVNGFLDSKVPNADPLAPLDEIARQLAEAGLKYVEGEILVDDRLFAKRAGRSQLSGKITPAILSDNIIDVLIMPGKPQTPATVRLRPNTKALRLDSKVTTIPGLKGPQLSITEPQPGVLVVQGQVPPNAEPWLLTYEVKDSTAYMRMLFIEALERAGIGLNASPYSEQAAQYLPSSETYKKLRVMAHHDSPPLSEVSKMVLKVSHNMGANVLPMLVAAKQGKRDFADAMQSQRDLLRRAGIDSQAVALSSGAGTSVVDRLTPQATVELLRYMDKSANASIFVDCFPILGVDGTLGNALPPDSPAKGRVRAKPGTLTLFDEMNDRNILVSKSLAGYMTTARGHKLAFAIFVNDVPLKSAGDVSIHHRNLAKLCELIYLMG